MKKGDEANSFYLWLEHDIRSEAFTREPRWLLPVYSVTEWQGVDVFDMRRYRSLSGLVLEHIGGLGVAFRRCGTFRLNAKLNEDGPWGVRNSALQFDALEGVEPEVCSDAVVPIIPAKQPGENASDDERSIRYERRDGVKHTPFLHPPSSLLTLDVEHPQVHSKDKHHPLPLFSLLNSRFRILHKLDHPHSHHSYLVRYLRHSTYRSLGITLAVNHALESSCFFPQ
ncbi:hypothetical protein QBC36DRAFT_300856 [Triangularia setosa]|uniref:Uncharacterized protein n=1 Tax=Triangularia setosa TaxID=2587417 RepID=A0AAN6W818_9PEZI|nr:hypothetical protein QBC36DRAFT_300856 [Podospora setosa]